MILEPFLGISQQTFQATPPRDRAGSLANLTLAGLVACMESSERYNDDPQGSPE
ncbi:hypothetical protein [Ferrimicrobium sp.]|uniref:hypothetical protein n=1 Tax=Ferrimicrobium sp. TaxID=2926050 RepID=UPI00260858AE|nr:hypothetical protein [Ferrimicrobium sp.]